MGEEQRLVDQSCQEHPPSSNGLVGGRAPVVAIRLQAH